MAGSKGKILTIDQQIFEKKMKLYEESASLTEIYDDIFQEFCDEIAKGIEIIVIDNTNLSDWEYIRFVKKA